jgi:hypothetical protein
VFFAVGFTKQKKPEVFLGHKRVAVWAKTGQALYYYGNEELRRLDTRTGRSRSFGRVRMIDDVSPDEKYAVYHDVERVKVKPGVAYRQCRVVIRPLGRGPEETIYKTRGIILQETLAFLGRDSVAFTELSSGPVSSMTTMIVDIKGNRLVRMPGAWLNAVSADGSGLVYSERVNKEAYSHYYDVAKRKRVKLPPAYDGARIVYLSGKQLIYKLGNNEIRSLELSTQVVRKLAWGTKSGQVIRLAPSLTKYWTALLPIGEYSQPYLYVCNVPPQSVSMIKRIEAGRP